MVVRSCHISARELEDSQCLGTGREFNDVMLGRGFRNQGCVLISLLAQASSEVANTFEKSASIMREGVVAVCVKMSYIP